MLPIVELSIEFRFKRLQKRFRFRHFVRLPPPVPSQFRREQFCHPRYRFFRSIRVQKRQSRPSSDEIDDRFAVLVSRTKHNFRLQIRVPVGQPLSQPFILHPIPISIPIPTPIPIPVSCQSDHASPSLPFPPTPSSAPCHPHTPFSFVISNLIPQCSWSQTYIQYTVYWIRYEALDIANRGSVP